ncbi:MAG: PorT family protein [Flavobacteriales bacterium]|nr:PorT family protein [Flavobacteriales bacterium]
MFDREEPPLYWAPGKHGKPKLNTMKKLLCLAAAATIAAGAMAQGTGLKFGAKAGLNITNLPNNETGWVTKSKMGFHLGGVANYGFGRRGNFSALAELLFDTKGAKVQFTNPSGGTEDKPFSLSYINIPIQARYRLNFGLYFETGPYLGFLLGARFDGDSEYEDTDSSGNKIMVKYKDDLNGSDFGWAYGLGYINESGWGVGYRGFLGLKDISKDDPNDLDVYVMLNTGSQLSFMWMFGWAD